MTVLLAGSRQLFFLPETQEDVSNRTRLEGLTLMKWGYIYFYLPYKYLKAIFMFKMIHLLPLIC
ncbi:hypothetical protein [Salmonella phage 1586]|uniref:Uncharacterized protein n=3 Tax=Epseptimavirus TaxID=2732017 RepID=A0A6G9L7N3_9CAUD|nr:hypothetical protein AGC_0017 [Escherichia phage Eps7]YP_009858213.1 hypothetical protein HWD23_gp096 [Salmonella phage faergetype]MIO97631.1 hypothetical protein [Salmonella enterica subsp. enterica]UQT65327.1 hypothetical protein BD13_187 [Salmonella phage BD13]ACB97460.1 Hypothetical protein AGC_0017 [Escherichia phage Eps7]QIQ61518.1 hypothetical protein faergetype_161 [Salmonella phage faergetype]